MRNQLNKLPRFCYNQKEAGVFLYVSKSTVNAKEIVTIQNQDADAPSAPLSAAHMALAIWDLCKTAPYKQA